MNDRLRLDDASIFLTGGTGFIGSHLRQHLAESGNTVTLLVRPDSAVNRKSNESVVRGDITDPDTFSVDGHDTIVHLAAQTSVEQAIDCPKRAWDVNATGTLHVLESARSVGIERFLYASTASVYGPPAQLPIEEDQAPNPVEPYGTSKLAGDQLVRTYHQAYGLSTVVVRLFNVFGPHQPMHNVIPTIIEQGLDDDTIELGNLTPTRDFIYVADAVSGLMTVLTKGEQGTAYNVARGREVQIVELAEMIVELLETSPTITSIPNRQRNEGVEIPRHVADTTRLRSLGWSPEYDLRHGLRRMIEERS